MVRVRKKLQNQETLNFREMLVRERVADWGGPWRGARRLDAEKLRDAREDASRETYRTKFVIVYGWERDGK